MTNKSDFNRLSQEKSAYLKQHQDDPVHWWPFGPEALQRANDLQKPIFLSVGYSSCHWCHVMGRETFSNEEVANLLNENFICIKVDKEEFPDLDNYYQQACHLYTKSGGWPLSAFLLPNMKPYFVGTYFPLQSSDNNGTGFLDLVKELTRVFSEERDKVEENANNVVTAIAEGAISTEPVEFEGHFPHPMAIMDAIDQYKDSENGGYGDAPKFPNFAFYEWAIEQMLEGMIPKETGEHIINTVENMLMGGVFDHVRGGVHRYAIDKKWQAPHFEKMLYDQAGLLRLLVKTSLLYPSPLIYDSIVQTLTYLETEMVSENGYFFSSQDAESEGVEGLFFTYTKEEFEDAINRADTDGEELASRKEVLTEWFQISEEGNFHSKLNIISLNTGKKQDIFTTEGWDSVRKIREALLTERKQRIPPATDTKGIASWNFMLISALTDILQYCKIAPIRRQASTLFNKVLDGVYQAFLINMTGEENPHSFLRHTTTQERTLPYLEDYVNFAELQLRVYEISGNITFKTNFLDTLQFIKKEFLTKTGFLTRARSTEEHTLVPNQEIAPLDMSFKSPASTLISLFRRGAVLSSDKDLLEDIKEVQECITHQALKNPLGSGEALRALSYPDQAYRVIKLPLAWADNEKFINFMPYFLPRFVLDYNSEEKEVWQICNINECELQGVGMEEFFNTLRPQPPEKIERENMQGDDNE